MVLDSKTKQNLGKKILSHFYHLHIQPHALQRPLNPRNKNYGFLSQFVCVVSVFMCVWERERERERGRGNLVVYDNVVIKAYNILKI